MSVKEGSALWDFRAYMFDHLVPISEVLDHQDEPITKILPYWRKKGLTPFLPKGQWTYNISFAEVIWLRMLDTLRRFSVSLELMQKLTSYLFNDAYDNHLAKKNLLYNKERLQKKANARTLTPDDARLLTIVESSLNDPQFLEVMKLDVNYLTNLIINTIETSEDRAILLFEDGSVAEQYNTQYYSHRADEIDPTKPHVRLSILHYLSEFFEDSEVSDIVVPSIVDEHERGILKEMKDKNVKEITVTMRDGKPVKIQSTRGGVISGEQAKEVKRILGLKNYESIQIDTRDERTLAYKKTRKK